MSNQAKWMPEAGGYVYDNKVVSNTPIYNADGTQEVDIDVSRLTPQQPTVTQNPETPNLNLGTQENQAGSGEDVNSVMTQANSMNALSENTANTGYGPINTPATHSNVAGEPAVTPILLHVFSS